jgi:lysozyme family protein
MADFGPALEFLLPHEGGYSNNPADKGGPTNYGITQATARRNGYNGDMRELPQETAAAIYQGEYWPGLEQIQSQAVASKIFDLRVNFGPAGGNRLAQEAANNLVEPPTAVDGRWGPDTVATINAADPAAMLDELATAAAARYQAIVDNDPSQETFLRGWMRRALDIPVLAGGAIGLTVLLGIGAALWYLDKGGRA